jgi:transposase
VGQPVKDQAQRCPRCEPTQRENRRLRKQVRQLSNKIGQLEQEKQKLRQQHERDQQEISQLKGQLEKQRRAGKRQAAPFSRGKPKKHPKRPGRKRGSAYGPKAHRPAPERVDQILDAPLPQCCPDCHGAVEESDVVAQYQTDLPPRIQPRVTQFNVHVGHCVSCNRRFQGRHPLQTSDALGAAASQVGPRALALAADLKVAGLSFGKLSGLFAKTFGISITPGGLCQGLHRLARATEPTYEALKDEVRNAACVTPDETGWRVGGVPAWLWVYVTTQVTVYVVEPGRGFDQAAKVLGEDFSGSLVRDGWAPYRKFQLATHQSCLNHLLTRCDEILETAQRGAARFPHAVKRRLNQALSLRDRWDEGKISPHGLAVATGRLRAEMNRLLAWRPRDEENRRFAKHLRTEQTALFTFLERPEVPATNHLAERALRPPVATRKNCGGGNRTWKGAGTLGKIASVFRTALQQGLDPDPVFVSLLRSPKPTVARRLLPGADLDGSARSPPPSP